MPSNRTFEADYKLLLKVIKKKANICLIETNSDVNSVCMLVLFCMHSLHEHETSKCQINVSNLVLFTGFSRIFFILQLYLKHIKVKLHLNDILPILYNTPNIS